MSTSTTTNYGWTIPNDDELVKNGAAAIRTLGQAIDTTAAASFAAGLVHINTTTFSGVSSVSLPNDTFTSTYDNYYVVGKVDASTGAYLDIRFRASGTDASGTDYYQQRGTFSNTSIVASRGSASTSGLINLTPNTLIRFSGVIFTPKLASNTYFQPMSGGGDSFVALSSIRHILNNAYDSMTYIPHAGTISGTIYTYGMKI